MASVSQIAAADIDAFNAHDEERIRALHTENAVLEAPGEVRLEGREATTQYAMAWLRAFPDARLEVHNEVEAGPWVVQELRSKARTRRPCPGRAATFRPPTGTCVAVASRS